MKNLKRLFLLGGLFLLTGNTVNAELVNGVRQRPNVSKTETFQVDTEFYLFNLKARLFFLGANDWKTRASVGEHGYKVRFTNYDQVPGAYEFTDFVETRSQWYSVFSTADGGAIWVDNAGETYRFWELVEQPNGIYRLSNNTLSEAIGVDAEGSIAGKFLGWNGSDADTRLYFVDPAADDAAVDWVFVTKETHDSWVELWNGMKDQFNAAANLLTYINSAKEKNIDVSDEVSVYENEDATVEQLNAATATIQLKINNALAGDASVNNPSDMTNALLNPNFDNASSDGWKGTAPNMTGDGNHGKADVAEHYDKTFDTYQELVGMPAGVYMLSNNGFLRGWWDDAVNHTNYTAYLYAEAGVDTFQVAMANPWEIKNTEAMAGDTEFGTTASEATEDRDGGPYYAPNDPSAARLYFEKGYYQNKVFFAVEDGNVKLGVKKGVNRGSEWATFDSFKLMYFGNAAEAYQYWVSQTPKTNYSESVVSDQYLQAYEAAFSSTASNKAEAKAAMAAIQAASDSIAKNSQLWATVKTKYDDATTMVASYQTLIAASALADYLEYGYYNDEEEEIIPHDILDAEEKTGDNDLSNEQLRTVIDKIDELIAAVDKEAKEGVQPGTDVTRFLANPGFEEGTIGWTIVSKGGGNVQLGGNADNHCYEAWHSTNFNVYQEVSDLPIGVYEISVNGYMRYLDGQDAINRADDVPENVPIYVYMNDSKTNFVNWLSYPKPAAFYETIEGATFLTGDEGSYPDNMIAASAAFADGGYLQSAKCLVAEEGTVTRIGVKGTPEAKFWPIFDNFRLTYLGMDVNVIQPLLAEQMTIAYDRQKYRIGRATMQKLNAALLDGELSIENADGEAMFAALHNLMKAINEVDENNLVMLNYESKLYELQEALDFSENQTVIDEVTEFLNVQFTDVYSNNVDENELEDLLMQIAVYHTRLLMPDYAEASAENPVDMTSVIVNPGFKNEEYEFNTVNGWNVTGRYNFGNDEYQRGAFALEFYNTIFDISQTITGLPEGWYQLRVNAFCRSSYYDALLYATSDMDYIENIKTVKRKDDTVIGQDVLDMVSSVEAFENGYYENRLNVYVGPDGILKIGMLKEENGSTDWTILDNWKLFYTGYDVISDDNPEDPLYIEPTTEMLYIADGTQIIKGDALTLPISLRNEQAIKALQFDVVLPAGMTYEWWNTELKGYRIYDHYLNYDIVSDGSIRMVIISNENEPLYGNDGVLVNLGLNIPSYMPAGNYTVKLKNVVMTTSQKQTIKCNDMSFTIKVSDGKLGDVNHDEDIDITDVVLIIDNILMKNPTNFDASLADVNKDGEIDVTDVVMVIDVILGRAELSRTATHEYRNLSDYTAFQMDLTIPAGYVLESASLTEIAKDSHSLAYNMLADGRFRVVVYSMDKEALPGSWDEVIRLNLRGQGDAQVSIDHATFVTIGGECHELQLNPTSIAQISALKFQLSNLYDLQGRKVEKTAKGIFVVDGKKTVRK